MNHFQCDASLGVVTEDDLDLKGLRLNNHRFTSDPSVSNKAHGWVLQFIHMDFGASKLVEIQEKGRMLAELQP